MSARGAVNLNELPPEVQAKIALQISGASIDRESLARKVVDSMTGLTTTLKDLEDDIRRLWFEFDNLKDGETIMGCSTKKAFCETHLKKTPRAVRYMLAGGNTNRGETFSPDEPDEDVPAEPESQPKQNGIFNLLSALQKAIRRNDEREALLAAWQLDAETGRNHTQFQSTHMTESIREPRMEKHLPILFSVKMRHYPPKPKILKTRIKPRF